MPQHCEDCNLDLPDAVNVGNQGLVSVNNCPHCGEELDEDDS